MAHCALQGDIAGSELMAHCALQEAEMNENACKSQTFSIFVTQ
jgi:hypothetical protein